jgi:anti-sigma B factor antagonist
MEQRGDALIVRVHEHKLTYPVLSAFLAEVGALVDEGERKLVIDLEAVTYIDSATIGCLVEIHRLLEDHGGAVKLSGLQRRVHTMLTMTGVHKIVDVCRDEAEALAAFRPQKQGGTAMGDVAGAASGVPPLGSDVAPAQEDS